jgi:hypothetical protein
MACKAEAEGTLAVAETCADMTKVGTGPVEVSALEEGGALQTEFLATFVSSDTGGARTWAVPGPAFSARIAEVVRKKFSKSVLAKYTSELEYS